MDFNNQMNEYLKDILGSKATFREGQIKALNSIKDNKKALIVQKTGWGKSLVYFLGTKYQRDKGIKGLTVVVSPLISLMRDQIRNAEKFGLRAEMIIYTSPETYRSDFDTTKEKLLNKEVDILFVSPERFANKEFNDDVLPYLDIKLFVIDEAHCISNWGHDFRPDYMRLVEVYNELPKGTPLVLTTATANDRVVSDIENQFGNELLTIRGELTRESLEIQVIKMPTQALRLAWLKENITKINGSGIIYCATVRDTLKVSAYLRSHNINVEEYHGSIDYEDRIKKEEKLINNDIKALVSTNALGMGFDKGDLAFVIHFQAPGSLVSYYQEIGRAGRNIDKSKIVLLNGLEDERIQRAFIDAKISETDLELVLNIIANAPNGLKQAELLDKLNIGRAMVETALKVLLINIYITKDGPLYFKTNKHFSLDLKKEEEFQEAQYRELEEFREFINTKECYMKFIANKLNDYKAEPCGRCANCIGSPLLPVDVSKEALSEAVLFLNDRVQMIKPRAQKPFGINIKDLKPGNIKQDLRNEEGRFIATYGVSGYGEQIEKAITEDANYSIDLLDVSERYIRTKWANALSDLNLVTYIPSYHNNDRIESFAKELANRLNLPFKQLVQKVHEERPLQRDMQNPVKQFENAYYSYNLNHENITNQNILLIDELHNSGFTMFSVGLKLKESGSGKVYPFALASLTWY